MTISLHAERRIWQRVHRSPFVRAWFLRQIERARATRLSPDHGAIWIRMGRRKYRCILQGGVLVTVYPGVRA